MSEETPANEAVQVKLKLTIAYDGTNYKGWQIQPSDNTVQQCVEEALRRLFPSVERIQGSSRTDTGVHAMGMVAHAVFDEHEFRMKTRKIPLALNAFLPEDIRVIDVKKVPFSFHARFDSQGKQYQYKIWNHRSSNPVMRGLTWHVPVKLNIQHMKQAAQYFLGRQDFRSLAANRDYTIENTTRTLYRCDVRASGPLITVVIEGDGFLYKMCRSIVGTLCLVGHGKKSPDDIPKLLQQQAREHAGMSAPPHGLTLQKVYYSNFPKRSSSIDSAK